MILNCLIDKKSINFPDSKEIMDELSEYLFKIQILSINSSLKEVFVDFSFQNLSSMINLLEKKLKITISFEFLKEKLEKIKYEKNNIYLLILNYLVYNLLFGFSLADIIETAKIKKIKKIIIDIESNDKKVVFHEDTFHFILNNNFIDISHPITIVNRLLNYRNNIIKGELAIEIESFIQFIDNENYEIVIELMKEKDVIDNYKSLKIYLINEGNPLKYIRCNKILLLENKIKVYFTKEQNFIPIEGKYLIFGLNDINICLYDTIYFVNKANDGCNLKIKQILNQKSEKKCGESFTFITNRKILISKNDLEKIKIKKNYIAHKSHTIYENIIYNIKGDKMNKENYFSLKSFWISENLLLTEIYSKKQESIIIKQPIDHKSEKSLPFIFNFFDKNKTSIQVNFCKKKEIVLEKSILWDLYKNKKVNN